MTRRMLINALYPEECRVAVADDDFLLELEIERADLTQLKGNIYKAPITRVEPSLQAAFLDIGSNRNGFLQINDVNPSYYLDSDAVVAERPRPSIQDVLRPGQELVVQVVKDERAAKGATLTTNLSIPGRFLVLMVGNQRGGVSRKIIDEGQRRRLRQAVEALKIPSGMGVIVRTAGINKSPVELQKDLDALLELWFEIIRRNAEPGSPRILYKESDLAIRTIRDYLTGDIEEILIDEPKAYQTALDFVRRTIPSFESRVLYFDKPQPLFSSFHLDSQVEATNQPEVTLPSGGSIVINVTEAVVAIDVNSGRSTGQSDVEETAYETNKEAADEIAKQLRLRDLGGLIVLDFIDMTDKYHKQIVERTLKDAVRYDKAKIEIGRISKFGLLEMSRQRLKSSLTSQSHSICGSCKGRGRVMSADSAALQALRKIQSAAFAGGVSEIKVHMAPSAALMLLNDKRQILSQFESMSSTRIRVFADGRLKPEEYQLELVTAKADDAQSVYGALAMSTNPSRTFDRIPAYDPHDGRRPPYRGGQQRYGDRGNERQGDRGGERQGERQGERSGDRGGDRRGGGGHYQRDQRHHGGGGGGGGGGGRGRNKRRSSKRGRPNRGHFAGPQDQRNRDSAAGGGGERNDQPRSEERAAAPDEGVERTSFEPKVIENE